MGINGINGRNRDFSPLYKGGEEQPLPEKDNGNQLDSYILVTKATPPVDPENETFATAADQKQPMEARIMAVDGLGNTKSQKSLPLLQLIINNDREVFSLRVAAAAAFVKIEPEFEKKKEAFEFLKAQKANSECNSECKIKIETALAESVGRDTQSMQALPLVGVTPSGETPLPEKMIEEKKEAKVKPSDEALPSWAKKAVVIFDNPEDKKSKSGVGTIRYPDGSVYRGDIIDGKPFGKGRFELHQSDGTTMIITGDFMDGLPEGQCRMEDVELIQEGECVGGKLDGLVTVTSKTDQQVKKVRFEKGEPKILVLQDIQIDADKPQETADAEKSDWALFEEKAPPPPELAFPSIEPAPKKEEPIRRPVITTAGETTPKSQPKAMVAPAKEAAPASASDADIQQLGLLDPTIYMINPVGSQKQKIIVRHCTLIQNVGTGDYKDSDTHKKRRFECTDQTSLLLESKRESADKEWPHWRYRIPGTAVDGRYRADAMANLAEKGLFIYAEPSGSLTVERFRHLKEIFKKAAKQLQPPALPESSTLSIFSDEELMRNVAVRTECTPAKKPELIIEEGISEEEVQIRKELKQTCADQTGTYKLVNPLYIDKSSDEAGYTLHFAKNWSWHKDSARLRAAEDGRNLAVTSEGKSYSFSSEEELIQKGVATFLTPPPTVTIYSTKEGENFNKVWKSKKCPLPVPQFGGNVQTIDTICRSSSEKNVVVQLQRDIDIDRKKNQTVYKAEFWQGQYAFEGADLSAPEELRQSYYPIFEEGNKLSAKNYPSADGAKEEIQNKYSQKQNRTERHPQLIFSGGPGLPINRLSQVSPFNPADIGPRRSEEARAYDRNAAKYASSRVERNTGTGLTASGHMDWFPAATLGHRGAGNALHIPLTLNAGALEGFSINSATGVGVSARGLGFVNPYSPFDLSFDIYAAELQYNSTIEGVAFQWGPGFGVRVSPVAISHDKRFTISWQMFKGLERAHELSYGRQNIDMGARHFLSVEFSWDVSPPNREAQIKKVR